jgi:hypothetical protein
MFSTIPVGYQTLRNTNQLLMLKCDIIYGKLENVFKAEQK